MSALDTAADRLRSKSQKLAAQGGVKAKLGELLAEDAAFLPKLKPELIKKRIKGDAPTDRAPTPTPAEAPKAPSGPQLGSRPKTKKQSTGGGISPFVVIGVALVLGVGLAKWLDLRGHAHPRW